MPLPPAAPRIHAHTRTVTFHGYARGDGLWDIEASMTDTKAYDYKAERALVRTGEPMHDMTIRVTLDDAFIVRDIATSMDSTPFAECLGASGSMQSLIGAKMGSGWRQTIERAIGGVQGCTHLRELLYNCATAAYQTIPHYQSHQRQDSPSATTQEAPPFYMGKCLAWDFDGPVVKRVAPQFAGWKPLKKR